MSSASLVSLWSIVALFESYRLYAGDPLEPKFALLVGAGSLGYLLPSSRSAAVLAYSLVIAVWALKVPFAWDSEYWAFLTDVAVALLLCLGAPVAAISGTVRWQMAIFYLAAGFWKLNTSFLNPSTSCASIYIAQLLDVLVPASLEPSEPVRFAAIHAAPATTIVGECSIGVLLLLPSAAARRLGVALALTLHLGIALTPPPNNIAEYGVMCLIRLLWLLPAATASALDEARRGLLGVHLGAGVLLASAIAARGPLYVGGGLEQWRELLAAADGSSHLSLLRQLLGGLDLPAALYGFISSVALRAIALDATSAKPAAPKPAAAEPPAAELPSLGVRALQVLLVALAAFYSFGTPMLGLLDISSPNMFSNLRMQGGSNHLLLPTSLMQQWHYAAPAASAFSGGVVRVEATNSSLLNALHPAELTPTLRPAAKAYLQAAGHSGRQWNSAVSQVVGSFAVPPNPASSGGAFVKWTVPAAELRRLVSTMRDAGEAFVLRYSHLEGARGDEAWRRSSPGRLVTLIEDGKGGRWCFIGQYDRMYSNYHELHWLRSRLSKQGPCDADELVLQPPPDKWAPLNWLGAGMSWNSYPIIQGAGPAANARELHCYGS